VRGARRVERCLKLLRLCGGLRARRRRRVRVRARRREAVESVTALHRLPHTLPSARASERRTRLPPPRARGTSALRHASAAAAPTRGVLFEPFFLTSFSSASSARPATRAARRSPRASTSAALSGRRMTCPRASPREPRPPPRCTLQHPASSIGPPPRERNVCVMATFLSLSRGGSTSALSRA